MDNKNNTLLGLGIAGNSAGHLQQTGESKGFSQLVDANKPQALFPFYVPGAKEGYLSVHPYSEHHLHLPDSENAKVQMEPELALKLSVSYGQQGLVEGLKVLAVTVINDATYRNADIVKLAQKKNWGTSCKGLADHEIMIDAFTLGSSLDHFRLCGFHQRDSQWSLCGDDVALNEYSYFYEDILQWLVTQIQTQQNKGPLHNIQDLLTQADHPENILVAIGATRYSSYGETHQLISGDQSAVILYDSRAYKLPSILHLLEDGNDLNVLSNEKIVCLHQHII
tara:strand:+ start:16070 stop:16912 length:843 start_codon:yes stop_codon:yes gene_type:complete